MSEHDTFFQPLENDRPYFKAAFQGFAGSGKTYTTALVAEGLHKRIQSTKPIAVFDTERAFKFLRPFFAERGISVIQKPSRTLPDLQETMRLCEAGAADILIIDSLSHVWEDYIESFKKRMRTTQLQFQHWGILKPEWKRGFSDPFVNSRLHILMTGRAGYEYGRERDEESGKMELVKTGTKMRVEGETAYEPDLLVEMYRMQQLDAKKHSIVWREAMVLKDRSTLTDGKVYRNPDYAAFEPVISFLLADPTAPRHLTTRSAEELFETQKDKDDAKLHRKILLEQIEAQLVMVWPGQAAKDKKAKAEELQKAFGTSSWTAVTLMPLSELKQGLDTIRADAEAQAPLDPGAGDTET